MFINKRKKKVGKKYIYSFTYFHKTKFVFIPINLFSKERIDSTKIIIFNLHIVTLTRVVSYRIVSYRSSSTIQ